MKRPLEVRLQEMRDRIAKAGGARKYEAKYPAWARKLRKERAKAKKKEKERRKLFRDAANWRAHQYRLREKKRKAKDVARLSKNARDWWNVNAEDKQRTDGVAIQNPETSSRSDS